ncbi:MAG: carbohydrate-binding protein, partial [Verrucomicrobiaceae bacterium]
PPLRLCHPHLEQSPIWIGTNWVEAETMAWESGIETQPFGQGGIDVCDINDGDSIEVRNVDFALLGAGAFTAKVASDTAPGARTGGRIELHLDSASGPVVGNIAVPYTGGLTQWQNVTTSVSGATGVHDLYLTFRGGHKGNLFNFDAWKFEKRGDARQLVAISAAADAYEIDLVPGSTPANVQVWAIYADGTRKDVTKKARWRASRQGLLKIKRTNPRLPPPP